MSPPPSKLKLFQEAEELANITSPEKIPKEKLKTKITLSHNTPEKPPKKPSTPIIIVKSPSSTSKAQNNAQNNAAQNNAAQNNAAQNNA